MKISFPLYSALRGSYIIICFCLALLSMMRVDVARAAISYGSVEHALAQRICFGTFWWGAAYKLGQTVPIVVRSVGDKAYVWSVHLSVFPHVKVMANYFTVFSSGDRAMVGQSIGYNVAVMRKAWNFKQDRAHVFGGPHSTVMFHVPKVCQPKKVGTLTPRKRLMLNVIVSTVIQELILYRGTGGSKLPRRVKIIIANFNPDDPAAVVFVPSAGYVFYVFLHKSSNPFSNTFLRHGEFRIQPEYSKWTIGLLSPLIEKYGIVRYVLLP